MQGVGPTHVIAMGPTHRRVGPTHVDVIVQYGVTEYDYAGSDIVVLRCDRIRLRRIRYGRITVLPNLVSPYYGLAEYGFVVALEADRT